MIITITTNISNIDSSIINTNNLSSNLEEPIYYLDTNNNGNFDIIKIFNNNTNENKIKRLKCYEIDIFEHVLKKRKTC